MSKVISNIAISLDGYVAGPDQSLEAPIGVGGSRVHEWMFATSTWSGEGERTVDDDAVEAIGQGGAFIMGRNMFGPGRGEWDLDWKGWWGDEPPYHAPVFVLTNHPREPLVMEGTTFTFVTDGIDSALKQAREAAGDQNVSVAGGASTIRQFLQAGLLDELTLHITPVIMGRGERLLDDIGDTTFEQVAVVPSKTVIHATYRVVR
ncbi:dihydrofolate reductase family protein [Actinocrispum sp. NPDC049592]|uniref:dihydrofolate reductase family protein n=1 Tax=Actinocrispum sp. NPDC049592 TaxID=3154835 RepID=UPI003427528B